MSEHEVKVTPHSEMYEPMWKRALEPVPSILMGTRFAQFDQFVGGFRPREFTILCGATGTGKTTLLANWSAALIEQNIPHFVASVETGPLDFMTRVASAMAGEDFNTGDPVSTEKARKFHVDHGHKFQKEGLWLSLYEDRFSVDTLIKDITFMYEKHGCKIAMIDNLNFFMEVTRASDQVVEMDRVIHNLIIFCKQIDIHIVMVMHPKKTESGRVLSEFDIKGSSTAVQEAHNVFLFNRAGKDLIDNGHACAFDRELVLQKMRRKGVNGGKRLILRGVSGVKYEEGGHVQ